MNEFILLLLCFLVVVVVMVKNCAVAIWNKDYWDEESASFVKKWRMNRTTARLAFTNKWVYGLLRRQQAKRVSLPADTPHAIVKAATAAASASKQANNTSQATTSTTTQATSSSSSTTSSSTSSTITPKMLNVNVTTTTPPTVAGAASMVVVMKKEEEEESILSVPTKFIPASSSSLSETEGLDNIDVDANVDADVGVDYQSHPGPDSASLRGRPVCDEFEEAVIAECESSLENNSGCFKRKRASSGNDYSYAQVKVSEIVR
jgi:hypothetical protein